MQYLALHLIVFALVFGFLTCFRKRSLFIHLLVFHWLLLTTIGSKQINSIQTKPAKTRAIATSSVKDSEAIRAIIPQCDQPTLTDDEGMWEFDRYAYVNETFEYQVAIPDGLVALRTPCPQPDHGFFVRLSKDRLPRIYVNANYNAFFWPTVEDAYKAEIRYLKDTYQSVVITKYQRFSLDGLTAIRFVADCKTKDARKTVVEDQVLAFSDKDQIVYEISMTTYQFRYRKDKRALYRFIRNWQVVRFGVTDYVCNQ